MKHKHAELIKAWADGEVIQHYSPSGDCWVDCSYNHPQWCETTQYRIKPIPKEPVVMYHGIQNFNRKSHVISGFADKDITVFRNWDNKVKLTFDGDTGELLTAEVVK